MQAFPKESRPKVAVITRTKDRSLFLRRAMESVLSQSLQDWVHVIVNDGGEAETVDFLVRCEAERYRGRCIVVHHRESQGMQNASNAGIAASDSDYLVIHDDDDSWQPEFLEQTVGILETEPLESTVRGVVTQSIQVFEEVQLNGQLVETGRQNYQPFDSVTLEALRKGNLFAPIAFLYRRSVHEQVGLFRQEFDVLGDHDFNLRFVRHFDIHVLDDFHANYHWRQHSFGNTVTRQRSVHRKMLAKLKNAYAREVLERSPKAVGLLDEIPVPPPEEPTPAPLVFRGEESDFKDEVPDFEASFDFDVLSLDIFDTVLLRRTFQPIDVFEILEEKAVSQLGLPPGPYALGRKEAEEQAREDVEGGEVNIDAIYTAFGELFNLDSGVLEDLRDLELQIEREMLFPDPRWVSAYRRYRELGKRVLFISDMYWPAPILRDLLSHFGFEDPEVYVSCDFGCSKHTGSLQAKLLERLELLPEKILHVGDNFRSDFVRSRQAGMQAFHWKKEFLYVPWSEQVDTPPRLHSDPLSRRLIGEARRLELVEPLDSSKDPLMERIGREIAGPLYVCFLNWLIRAAQRDEVHKLVFLGRDGYYWEKTLRILNQRYNLGVEFTYLDASRKVLSFASFRVLDDRAIEFLSTPNPNLKARDFIDRTGLDSKRYEDEIRCAGFSSGDEILTTDLGGGFIKPGSRRRLRILFLLIENDLLARFKRCRAGVEHSLLKAGFTPEDSALVDIGWIGSSASALAHLLDLEGNSLLRSYYFGTWEGIKKAHPAVHPRSFFVHQGEPGDLRNLLFQSVNFFETLHGAPIPTLIDYESTKEGEYQPVFSVCDRSGLSEEEQGHLWTGVKCFLDAISGIGFPFADDMVGLNYLERVLQRILQEPSPNERRRIGKILHSEGFGLEVNKPLILPVNSNMKDQEIMNLYRGSNWKRGFLAELNEKQRKYVVARLTNDSSAPVYEPRTIPWHTHVYRWYRRTIGDPKYAKKRRSG